MSSQNSALHITHLGVAGAGTMGSGIALAALLADIPVVLYEPARPVLDRAHDYIQEHLNRRRKAISIKYLRLSTNLEDLSDCQAVIEAIPEDLALKQELFARLDSICPPPAVLATNTSTLSVTAIAAAVSDPARVAGMHFFNPAPVLPLVEVVSGESSSPETVQVLVRLAGRLGKTPVIARDTPGFIVNRVARPFYGEALRLLGEGVASHEQIDQIVRLGGGFRMGPFELMDLIGIDINFTATQSIYEQTFQEPRYRPHLIQAQMVAQKALGRKSGRGFYRYVDGKAEATADPAPVSSYPPPPPGAVCWQPGSWAPGMEALLCERGFKPLPLDYAGSLQPIAGISSAGRSDNLQAAVVELDRRLPAELPILCQCADVTLAEIASWIDRPARLVGFDGLFLTGGAIATLVAGPDLSQPARQAAEALFLALDRRPIWIEDSPALVLPRLVGCLVNEAAFAAGEDVAEPEVIDLAMQLGTNYPKGPAAWGEALGFTRVLAVLDHLRSEYGEERYRPAPLLKRWARLEKEHS